MAEDASELDTRSRQLKAWLRRRLKAAHKDSIDDLAKRLLADTRIPRAGSRSLYMGHLRSKGYTVGEIKALGDAWREMLNEEQIVRSPASSDEP